MTRKVFPASAPQSMTHRADLIRIWEASEGSGFDAFAKNLGFAIVEKAEKPAEEKGRVTPGTPPPKPKPREPSPESPAEDFQWPIWRATQFEPNLDQPQQEVPEWYRKARPLRKAELLRDETFIPPTPPDLMPWRNLWVYLRNALGCMTASTQLDTDAWVRHLAKGIWPRKVPYTRRLRWQPSVTLIVDYQPHLTPIHLDMVNLCQRLAALRSQGDLQIWVITDGVAKPWVKIGAKMPKAFNPPKTPGPVLVLSDLGLLDATGKAQTAWLELGKRLLKQGCLPLALVPLSRESWDMSLAEVWRMMPWSAGVRVPKRTEQGISRLLPVPKQKQAQESLDQVLALMAPCRGVERGLLRELRLVLGESKRVELELAVWNHSDVERLPDCVVVEGARRQDYLLKFAQPELRKQALQALDLYRRYHTGLPKSVLYAELDQAARLLGIEHSDTQTFFERVAVTFDAASKSRREYLRKVGLRGTQHVWTNKAFVASWLKTQWPAILEGKVILPDEVDLHAHSWILELTAQRKFWQLLWDGPSFRFQSETERETEDFTHGSPMLRFESFDGLGQVQFASGDKTQPFQLTQPLVLDSRKNQSFELSVNTGTYSFSSAPPTLGKTWQFDERGLKTWLSGAEGRSNLRWLSPGNIHVQDAAGQLQGTWALMQGTWMAEDQVGLFESGIFTQPDWCAAVGVDDSGIFADAKIRGITQRFRWIWPGTFLMGSPEGELERRDNETQHEVTLSRGYWLADTACTQALWQAITGENPSRFIGEELPVENVSWNDCYKQLQRLNQEHPGLELRLPSEAQWEYACRARTQTIFHFGNSITTGQVNYDGDVPLAGSPEGEYRQKTVPVKALPANAWGLYQMHGNVFEWCQDWLAGYTAEAQHDPDGPDSGRRRVLRGGAWFSDGRYCRSAFRVGYAPVIRYRYTGFRLARGQKGPEASKQQAPGPTAPGDRVLSDQGGERQL